MRLETFSEATLVPKLCGSPPTSAINARFAVYHEYYDNVVKIKHPDSSLSPSLAAFPLSAAHVFLGQPHTLTAVITDTSTSDRVRSTSACLRYLFSFQHNLSSARQYTAQLGNTQLQWILLKLCYYFKY